MLKYCPGVTYAYNHIAHEVYLTMYPFSLFEATTAYSFIRNPFLQHKNYTYKFVKSLFMVNKYRSQNQTYQTLPSIQTPSLNMLFFLNINKGDKCLTPYK